MEERERWRERKCRIEYRGDRISDKEWKQWQCVQRSKDRRQKTKDGAADGWED